LVVEAHTNGKSPQDKGRRPKTATLPAARGFERKRTGDELARYDDTLDEQIYSVLHAAKTPRKGAVLICGPFAAERERAYLSLVQWSRTLAAQGFDALRFDYRGIGESTGRFEEMTTSRWREDAELCAAHLSEASRGVPLILHGVRFGALLAAELFAAHVGDALLMWAPPASATELLRDTLRHNLISQRFNDPDAPGRTRDEQIAAIEAGELVNVDGYSWSADLWRDAQQHPLIVPAEDERRPWIALHTRRTAGSGSQLARAETIEAGDFWGTSSMLLVPHVEGFVDASLRWLGESGAAQ
jgi:alpha/beta superfamily hydrolase